MKSLKDCFTLRNGVKIPCVGFGTWIKNDGEIEFDSVKEALNCGYRHIDTATSYGNEGAVGKAVKESGIPREEIFVTTKLWNPDQGYDTTLRAFEKSIKLLDMDYVDLYLIHWPRPQGHKDDYQEINLQTWRAFEKLYKEGRIRAIGVSNFKPHHLQPLMDKAEVLPMVNQIEFHVSHLQEETVEFCKKNDILVEAWGPLARGKIMDVESVQAMSQKYNKSIAQISLRWILQKGILPLPKSVTPSRIQENAQLFDFTLTDEDMKILDGIEGCVGTGMDPDQVKF